MPLIQAAFFNDFIMTKIKNIYPLIFLTFSLAYCVDKKEISSENEIIEIKIGSNSNDGEYKHLDLLKEKKFVELETNERSFVTSVNKVEFFENKFYVHDKKNESLLVFASDGQYLSKIGKLGSGPGEYIDLQDFCIDINSKEIIVLSTGKKQVIRYSLLGEYIGTTNLPFQSWSISQMGTEFFAHHVGYFDDRNTNLKIMDSENKELIYSMFEYPQGIHPVGMLAMTGKITRNNDGLLYSDQTSSYIHQVTLQGDHYPKYYINFGDSYWPEERRYEFRAFFKESNNKELNFLSSSYEESGNALAFGYTTIPADKRDRPPMQVGYFIKSTNQLFDHTNIVNNLSYRLISPPIGVTQTGYFISVIYPEYYYYYLDKFENNQFWEDLFSNIPQGSNPIILMYKL